MFETELLKCHQPLKGFALKLTHNHTAADDLVQETLLRCFERQHQFEGGTNLIGWSMTVMRNLFLSQIRRRKTVSDPDNDLANHMAVPATQEMTLSYSEFQKVFDKLKPEHKQSVILICVEGLSYDEAAAQLGVAVGTLKSRVSRARSILRENFEILDPDSISIGVSNHNDNHRYSHS